MGDLRAVFQSHRDRVPIHATHEQTEETTHGQELLEGLTVDGRDLQDTQNNHVDDHWPLPAKLVACQTETRRTNTSQQESEGNRRADISLGPVIVLRQLDGLDGQCMEIERIGCPRSETDHKEQPVARAQLHAQLDGVLNGLWRLPFSMRLPIFVGDNDTLLPFEQIPKGLLRCREDTIGDGVSGLVGGAHFGGLTGRRMCNTDRGEQGTEERGLVGEGSDDWLTAASLYRGILCSGQPDSSPPPSSFALAVQSAHTRAASFSPRGQELGLKIQFHTHPSMGADIPREKLPISWSQDAAKRLSMERSSMRHPQEPPPTQPQCGFLPRRVVSRLSPSAARPDPLLIRVLSGVVGVRDCEEKEVHATAPWSMTT